MTADPAALLRMLEPAVRPVGPAPSNQGQTPIEQRSFESLLNEVRLEMSEPMQSSQDVQTPTTETTKVDPLLSLHQFGAVENASLRSIIARA